jgi:RNA-dependent RNA polymerase
LYARLKATAVFLTTLLEVGSFLAFDLSLNTFIGDYDGDTALIIWEPEVVRHYQQPDDKFSLEPVNIKKHFTSAALTVSNMLKWPFESIEKRTTMLQRSLLGFLQDPSLLGTYAGYHINSMYLAGYDHPTTIELAYK